MPDNPNKCLPAWWLTEREDNEYDYIEEWGVWREEYGMHGGEA